MLLYTIESAVYMHTLHLVQPMVMRVSSEGFGNGNGYESAILAATFLVKSIFKNLELPHLQ